MNASSNGYSTEFGTFGSLALDPDESRFVLIDGKLNVLRDFETSVSAPAESKESSKRLAVSRKSIFAMAVAVVTFVLAASIVSSALRANAIESSFEAATLSTVTVEPGSTVWGYASRCNVKGASTTEVANWIESRNGVKSGKLKVGESLQLPNFQ